MSAKTDGEQMVKEFLDERVFTKTKSLNDKIPRSSRLNFDNQEVKDVKGAAMKGKVQEMERDALIRCLITQSKGRMPSHLQCEWNDEKNTEK